MHWSDEGLILGARRHGETSIILEVMTREHGRHLGLVHGGRSKRLSAVLQPGNSVEAVWRGRVARALRGFPGRGGGFWPGRGNRSPPPPPPPGAPGGRLLPPAPRR